MSELKPCPFCGGEATLIHIPDNTDEENEKHPYWQWRYPDRWVVGCDSSNCLGNYNNVAIAFIDKDVAIKTWNRRDGK